MSPRQWWEVFRLERHAARNYLAQSKTRRAAERTVSKWADKATMRGIHPEEIRVAILDALHEVSRRWGAEKDGAP